MTLWEARGIMGMSSPEDITVPPLCTTSSNPSTSAHYPPCPNPNPNPNPAVCVVVTGRRGAGDAVTVSWMLGRSTAALATESATSLAQFMTNDEAFHPLACFL
jgi:hypothetical protein